MFILNSLLKRRNIKRFFQRLLVNIILVLVINLVVFSGSFINSLFHSIGCIQNFVYIYFFNLLFCFSLWFFCFLGGKLVVSSLSSISLSLYLIVPPIFSIPFSNTDRCIKAVCLVRSWVVYDTFESSFNNYFHIFLCFFSINSAIFFIDKRCAI